MIEVAATPDSRRSVALRTDILIVGAGPTGLTLANLLGGMGVSAVLVERNSSTVDEPRAVSIDDESLRTMQAAGLSSEVEAKVARGYGSRYYSPSGRCFAVVDPQQRDYGFDKRNAFEQPEFEAVLRSGLERFPTIRTLFGHEVTSFAQADGRVTATVAGVSGPRAIEARYMVACDGARSAARKALDIALVGSTFRERWLIVDLARTENRFRHTEVFCNPARPCISLPGPAGIRRYEFMLHEGEDEDGVCAEPFVRDLLGSVGPDRHAPLRRVRVYAFHARLAERWRVGNVLLAGDAAHLTPPFAGQGMNSGVRDAHNLAWKLARAVGGNGDSDLLDSYESERRPHVGEMIQLALNMGRVMMPASQLQGALVRIGFRLLDLYPPARDYVTQMRYKPKPRFRRGLLWADGRSETDTWVGRLFPQPVVEDVHRQRHLLDDLLGAGWSMLVFSSAPEQALSASAQARFGELGMALIGLTPEWINPVGGAFPVARDVTRLLSDASFLRYAEHAFILRPDRYVAATAGLSDLQALDPCLAWLRTNNRVSSPGRITQIA